MSFARSHTLTSFDDAVVGLNRLSARSQERLIDGKKTGEPLDGMLGPASQQQLHQQLQQQLQQQQLQQQLQQQQLQQQQLQQQLQQHVVVVEKVKRAPMKTQATQTEVCLGRRPLPANFLSLSPKTALKVQ